jgi:hypothetical protein
MDDNTTELKEIPTPWDVGAGRITIDQQYSHFAKIQNAIVEVLDRSDPSLLKGFTIDLDVAGGLSLIKPQLVEDFAGKGWTLEISEARRIDRKEDRQSIYCSLTAANDLPGKVKSMPKGRNSLKYFAKIMGITVLAYGAVTAIFVGHISYLHSVGTCQAPQASLDQLQRDIELKKAIEPQK